MIPVPQLKTQWLEQFVMLCQEAHLPRAAAKLGVSRQTLQRSLEQLESHLQTPLVHKNGKAFQLTPAGVLFLQQARELTQTLQRLEQRFQAVNAAPLSGTLAFAWQSASCFDFVPRALAAFLAAHPGVFLHIQCEPDTAALQERLLSGQLDLALMDVPPLAEGLEWVTGRRSPFVIVSAPRPLCHWAALAYALPEQAPRNLRQKRWDESLYPRQVVCTSDSLDVLLDWACSGRAATFLPQITVQRYLDQGQLAIVAQPPEQIFKELFLCSAPGAGAKPAVRALQQSLHRLMLS
ncbi:MAG: LysR family transcriptional regulator [Candidatus Sericytochromatia bacterium]